MWVSYYMDGEVNLSFFGIASKHIGFYRNELRRSLLQLIILLQLLLTPIKLVDC